MSEDATHRLTGELIRNGEVYEAGTELTPTDNELEAFPDRFDEIATGAAEPEIIAETEVEATDADEQESGSESESEHPTPEEFTETPVAEYRSYVRSHDLSVDRLQAMLEAEREREDTRSTVVSLLEDALEDTAESDADGE